MVDSIRGHFLAAGFPIKKKSGHLPVINLVAYWFYCMLFRFFFCFVFWLQGLVHKKKILLFLGGGILGF